MNDIEFENQKYLILEDYWNNSLSIKEFEEAEGYSVKHIENNPNNFNEITIGYLKELLLEKQELLLKLAALEKKKEVCKSKIVDLSQVREYTNILKNIKSQ